MDITFDDPPLNEVVLGRVFIPRPDVLLPFYGDFWQGIKHEYPRIQQADAIIGSPEEAMAAGGLATFPRFWFVSEDSSRLLQLQFNRFHFNWRRASDGAAYIRFPAVSQECLKLWTLYDDYVLAKTGQALQPLVNELTYINFVEVPAAATPFDAVRQVLRDVNWVAGPRPLQPPASFSQTLTFKLPGETGRLQATVITGQREESGAAVVRLELSVRGKGADAEAFENWSKDAHDLLVEAFTDLTAPEMHAVWKLREQ